MPVFSVIALLETQESKSVVSTWVLPGLARADRSRAWVLGSETWVSHCQAAEDAPTSILAMVYIIFLLCASLGTSLAQAAAEPPPLPPPLKGGGSCAPRTASSTATAPRDAAPALPPGPAPTARSCTSFPRRRRQRFRPTVRRTPRSAPGELAWCLRRMANCITCSSRRCSGAAV